MAFNVPEGNGKILAYFPHSSLLDGFILFENYLEIHIICRLLYGKHHFCHLSNGKACNANIRGIFLR